MLPSLIGTAIALLTAVFGYRYLPRPANRYLALLAIAAAWVCAMQWAALLLPDNLAYRYRLAQLQYLGFCTGPVLWVFTALAYCRYQRALAIAQRSLWVVPSITLALAFSNDAHQQIWQQFQLKSDSPGLDLVYGPWFTVHVFYVYSLVMVGTALLARRFAMAGTYSAQLWTILLAPLAVFGLNFHFLLGLNPMPIDPTPTGLAVASLLVAVATRRRLFSVVPVARRATLDSLIKGVIVINDRGRIADTNRAARNILGIQGSGIGQTLERWLPEIHDPRIALGQDVQRPDGRHIHIRITAIGSGKLAESGKVIVLRDVTEERAAQARLLHAQGELQKLNAKLETMAHTDSLTGLVNRRRLNELLRSEWSRAQRHGHPLSIILLDFDYFKEINDTYGHLSGDEVLERAGQVLRETTRPEDVVARFGGEEFAILLPETELLAAIELAHRLHRALGKLRFEHERLGPFQMTCSLGIACKESGDSSPESLVARADDALYHSKREGRDAISVARGERQSLVPSS